MALARAGLVTFVDGDDFVSPHYVRALYEAHGGVPGRLLKAGFVLVDTAELEECGSEGCFQSFETSAGVQRFEGALARRSLLLGDLPHHAWGALAERSLYEQVPFKPSVLFEDIYSTVNLVTRLSELVLLEAKLYGYTQREGSFCHPVEPDARLLRDNLAAIRHFEDVVGGWGGELAACAPVKVARLYSALCTRALLFGERTEWGPYLLEARQFVRKNRGGLLRAIDEGWLSLREAASLVLKVTFPCTWLAARGVRMWVKGLRR